MSAYQNHKYISEEQLGIVLSMTILDKVNAFKKVKTKIIKEINYLYVSKMLYFTSIFSED